MCASYESQCEEFIELSIARTPGVSLCTFDPYRNLCRLQKNSANDISQERDSSPVLSFFFSFSFISFSMYEYIRETQREVKS